MASSRTGTSSRFGHGPSIPQVLTSRDRTGSDVPGPYRHPGPLLAGRWMPGRAYGARRPRSVDRRTAWEFWRCTAAGTGGYTADVILQWNLGGPGYSADGEGNSARGSGTPLISTSLRADEALNGVNHALGITVPSVSSDWVFP